MAYFDSDSEYEPYHGPPLVSQGAFTFKEGKFYAEFEGRCHPRTDATELYGLLIYTPPPPALTKAGTVAKRQPKDTHVDPDAHYYSAQMIHYGLKPLKTKIPAKKRMLAAFGDGKTLQVPKAILDLEKSMREEWQVLDTKYKEKQEEQRKIQTKRDEEARLERIKWKEVRLLEPQPAPTATLETKKTTDNGSAKPPPNSIQARVEAAVVKMPKLTTDVPKLSNGEMQKAILSLSTAQAHEVLATLLEKIPAVENVLNAELSLIKANSTLKIKEKRVDPSIWTGLYNVEAPMILDDQDFHGSEPSTLEIYPSSTSAHLWVSFELGVLKGVMRSLHPVPKFLNTEVYFEYRGYEAGEDTMTFSRDNRAILNFLPGGLFDGKINTECFGTFKIYGALQSKSTGRKSVMQQKEAVRSWKADFRSINPHNYEIAGTKRWGGWGGDSKDDKAFESDTTDGKQKRKKVHLHKFMKRAKDERKDNGMGNSDSDSDRDEDEDEDRDGYGYDGF